MTVMERAVEEGAEAGLCHCTALRKASRRISQLYDQALATGGLKTTQRAILAQLRRSGPLPVGALATALVKESNGFAHTLKPLERDGFIAYRPDPADRRSRLVSLTPAGRKKLKDTDALWEEAQAGFEAVVGASEAEALRSMLRILASDRFTESFAQALERAQGPPTACHPERSEGSASAHPARG
ncbi:MAG TPA: MarR family winged helix-turn-helix transcriptional regulator [Luteimonas sp.]|nr:MarR family winged helix-turn-helix transcriptional regulator [Luteimonas sp.]HRO26315.1 MarR family winged helix-turn-helix transcriptional regulator [Luteimonas sp.]HRP73263.1 MarR family winged helix-turn-helix transcriptional regulator [Luteimonas sp.]